MLLGLAVYEWQWLLCWHCVGRLICWYRPSALSITEGLQCPKILTWFRLERSNTICKCILVYNCWFFISLDLPHSNTHIIYIYNTSIYRYLDALAAGSTAFEARIHRGPGYVALLNEAGRTAKPLLVDEKRELLYTVSNIISVLHNIYIYIGNYHYDNPLSESL